MNFNEKELNLIIVIILYYLMYLAYTITTILCRYNQLYIFIYYKNNGIIAVFYKQL